ncbi:hypothetical protein N7G274_010758 [Stereocaulon virgatum]|uniref:DUF6570 domain-containing protein n=1 Tax=Stereocaulon virgatum TaxID=373712 RepID=A0ABR3ZTM8_9LECA
MSVTITSHALNLFVTEGSNRDVKNCHKVEQNRAQQRAQQRALQPPASAPVQDDISLQTLWEHVRSKDTAAPACSEKDWNLMTDFYGELGKLRREVCDVCKEIGFNMRLQDGGTQAVCVRCRSDDSEGPAIYSAANEMDPGPVPPHLPKLTMVEEMLIARAHI